MNSVLTQWKASGKFLQVTLNSIPYRIFYQATQNSEKPWMTLMHGFPASSRDFHHLRSELEKDYRVLTFDFLGFGLSDKPRDIAYSIIDQTDILIALWKELGINESTLLAHDFSISVFQELLCREEKKYCSKAILMNGSLYHFLHQPILIQKLMLNPVVGPYFSRLLVKSVFEKNINKVSGNKNLISQSDLDDMWSLMCENNGNTLSYKLLFYMIDRKKWHKRWEPAFENAPMNLFFIWGLEDPVSGRHVFEFIQNNFPDSKSTAIENAGHFPQLETPSLVIEKLKCLGLLNR